METEHLTLTGKSAEDRRKIAHAAEVLRGGGLVVFPTETVYGLGALADVPEALERLYEIKERDRGKPLAYHLADTAVAQQLARPFSRAAGKLMRLYWPGPLTLVVPGRKQDFVGLRHPSHTAGRALLAEVGAPVVATSANRSGGAEPVTPRQVLADLSGRVDVFLDAGPLPHPVPSTVVRVDGENLVILREGAISAREILEAARYTILFVCHGNTCRSPMAAALARRMLRSAGRENTRVLSAGTGVLAPEPANPLAVQVMKEEAQDLRSHRSRALTPDLLDQADDVIVMARAQQRSIIQMFPEMADRVRLLDASGRDIEDPVGGGYADYRVCADEIAACLPDVLNLPPEDAQR